MIAKTKFQKAVVSHRLPNISRAEMKDARQITYLPAIHKPYSSEKKGYCPYCGKEIDLPAEKCPHCDGEIRRELTKERVYVKEIVHTYSSTTTILGKDFQVVRGFLTRYTCTRNEKCTIIVKEVARRYIREDGADFVMTTQSRPDRNYSLYGKMELRANKSNPYSYYGCSPLEWYTDCLLDIDTADIIPKLRKYFGFTSYNDIAEKVSHKNIVTYIKAMLTKKGETIYKSMPELFDDYVQNKEWYDRFFHVVKICRRNNYTPDYNMKYEYRDYIKQLSKLNMDTHNPALICPKDLHKEHQRLTKILQRKAEELRKKEEMERLMRESKLLEEYAERMAAYANREWNTDNVRIVPLMTVEAVMDEGKHQHHCVYQLGYWKHAYNLLLTSFVGTTKAETIQIDLRTMKIVQSRGVNNTQTKYHDEIVNYINAHINEFKPRKKARIRKAA